MGRQQNERGASPKVTFPICAQKEAPVLNQQKRVSPLKGHLSTINHGLSHPALQLIHEGGGVKVNQKLIRLPGPKQQALKKPTVWTPTIRSWSRRRIKRRKKKEKTRKKQSSETTTSSSQTAIKTRVAHRPQKKLAIPSGSHPSPC